MASVAASIAPTDSVGCKIHVASLWHRVVIIAMVDPWLKKGTLREGCRKSGQGMACLLYTATAPVQLPLQVSALDSMKASSRSCTDHLALEMEFVHGNGRRR